MRLTLLFATLPLLMVVGCEKKSPDAATATPAAAQAETKTATPVTAAAGTTVAGTHAHNVTCACTLGKTCANLIEVKGQYVPLQSEGLGPMAFCGKTGLKAKVDGQLVGDKFVAKSFELVHAK